MVERVQRTGGGGADNDRASAAIGPLCRQPLARRRPQPDCADHRRSHHRVLGLRGLDPLGATRDLCGRRSCRGRTLWRRRCAGARCVRVPAASGPHPDHRDRDRTGRGTGHRIPPRHGCPRPGCRAGDNAGGGRTGPHHRQQPKTARLEDPVRSDQACAPWGGGGPGRHVVVDRRAASGRRGTVGRNRRTQRGPHDG